MIQIQISLPLLIKQKITNYLDFTIWREKITKVCQEYYKNYKNYKHCDWHCKNYTNIAIIYNNKKLYNYRPLERELSKILYTVISDNKCRKKGKLHPNY